jgi:hypothetical protein
MFFSWIKWQVGMLDLSDLTHRTRTAPEKGVSGPYAGPDLLHEKIQRDVAETVYPEPGSLPVASRCQRAVGHVNVVKLNLAFAGLQDEKGFPTSIRGRKRSGVSLPFGTYCE